VLGFDNPQNGSPKLSERS